MPSSFNTWSLVVRYSGLSKSGGETLPLWVYPIAIGPNYVMLVYGLGFVKKPKALKSIFFLFCTCGVLLFTGFIIDLINTYMFYVGTTVGRLLAYVQFISSMGAGVVLGSLVKHKSGWRFYLLIVIIILTNFIGVALSPFYWLGVVIKFS